MSDFINNDPVFPYRVFYLYLGWKFLPLVPASRKPGRLKKLTRFLFFLIITHLPLLFVQKYIYTFTEQTTQTMNTILNLQQEFSGFDQEALTTCINLIKSIPLTERIEMRGNIEQMKVRMFPNYFPDQVKRASKNFRQYLPKN